jgi:hypothetical protein
VSSRFTPSSAATHASTVARTPVSVELWNDFIDQARNGNWDTAPDYSPPEFVRSLNSVRSEFSVQMLLQLNLFTNLNKVLHEKFGPHSEYDGSLVGEPDFVATNLAGDLRLVIEAKTISSLAADDLVQAFRDDVHTKSNREVNRSACIPSNLPDLWLFIE